MRPHEIALGRRVTLTLALRSDRPPIEPDTEVVVFASAEDDPGSCLIATSAWTERAEAIGADALASLDQILGPDPARLSWVVSDYEQDGRRLLFLEFRLFVQAVGTRRTLQISLDDDALDKARARMRDGRATPDAVSAWFRDQFVLPPAPGDNGATRCIVTAGTGSAARTAFRIHGRDCAADLIEEDGVAHIRRLAPSNDGSGLPNLLELDITLVDASNAAAYSKGEQGALDALVADANGYLAMWEGYDELERESVEHRLRMIGHARYDGANRTGGVWRFHLSGARSEQFLDALSGDDAGSATLLEATTRPPEEVRRRAFAEDTADRDVFRGDVIAVDRHQKIVEVSVRDDAKGPRPPPIGFLHVSAMPDAIRLKRRRLARARLRDGSGGLPWLVLLLENQFPTVKPRKRVEPLSRAALEHFRGQPTSMQRKALDVALNTPDIALIQGPPGTGKTEVIAALQARLAELEDKDSAIGRTILLSSFQHDALDNAVDRTTVMDLPPLRVGRRAGSREPIGAIPEWRSRTVAAIRGDLGDVAPLRAIFHGLDALVLENLAGTSRRPPDQVLAEVRSLVGESLPTSLQLELARYEAPPAKQTDDISDGIRNAVANLPEALADFERGGDVRVGKALKLLRGVPTVPSELLTPLERVCDNYDDELPAELRTAGLDAAAALTKHLSPVVQPHASVEVDLLPLLQKVRDSYEQRLAVSTSGRDLVLADFADRLESDPRAADLVAHEYAAVLAATCQHSMSKELADLRPDISFPNVIIDEAARANPMDLMIPMALASRRIVLVGDHRQLPHMLEPDIERELHANSGPEAKAAMSESLFERLFRHLQDIEKTTGITRVVTLDTQFRMHPTLGRFVSENFYGDPEALQPGFPAESFTHEVPGFTGRVAGWIAVDRSAGGETGRRSKSRTAEARRVAELVESIRAEQPDLSVGVITFYAEQRQRIWAELSARGFAEKTDGVYGPSRGHEALKVGTVDAFQGTQFDVSILSIVRSNDLPSGTEADNRRRWGFLTLDNRLNVAMSRQRRLLVAVGDPAMIAGGAAREAVPALCNFFDLCRSDVGVVV